MKAEFDMVSLSEESLENVVGGVTGDYNGNAAEFGSVYGGADKITVAGGAGKDTLIIEGDNNSLIAHSGSNIISVAGATNNIFAGAVKNSTVIYSG